MTSAISQMTIKYDAREDRMIFRLGTSDMTEYRLYLTRRFVHILWPALKTRLGQAALTEVRVVGDPGKAASAEVNVPEKVQSALLGIQHQSAVQSSDFSTPHSEENRDLTSNSGPLLIISGTVGEWTGEGDARKLTLSFTSPDKQSFKVGLNSQLLHAFCHLIQSAETQANWGLELVMGEDPAAVPAPETVH